MENNIEQIEKSLKKMYLGFVNSEISDNATQLERTQVAEDYYNLIEILKYLHQRYITSNEVCELLDIGKATLAYWIQRGLMSTIKAESGKGKILFLRSEITNLLQKQS